VPSIALLQLFFSTQFGESVLLFKPKIDIRLAMDCAVTFAAASCERAWRRLVSDAPLPDFP
jgi:hypothetical protein